MKVCNLDILKFVNTKSQKFVNTSADVVQPPFEAESGKSLLYAIEQYGEGYEWVFKLDDVTYVFLDNLLAYLSQFDDHDLKSWWLGNRLQTDEKQKNSLFTSGGAGYLMNRQIITNIIEDIRQNKKYGCSDDKWEDLCISSLLNNKYGVTAANTIDANGFEKFNVWCPMTIFGSGGIYKLPIDWYSRYKRNAGQREEKVGFEYITKTPITFHYIHPDWMDAYYQLFALGKDAESIETISNRIGQHKDRKLRLNQLDVYSQIVRNHTAMQTIKNIQNELVNS